MTPELMLKHIAVAQHKQRAGRIKRRTDQQKLIGLGKAAFAQSKIPEMWEAVAHIEVPNPAPEEIAGMMVPLKDLKIPWSKANHTGNGLELYDKNDQTAIWAIGIDEKKSGGTLITYSASGYKFGFCAQYNTAEKGPNNAEINFVATFVKWLARKIPATTLIELGIDFNTIDEIEKELADAITITPKRRISRV